MKKLAFYALYFLYYESFAGFWNLINVYYELNGCSGDQIGIISLASLMIGMLVTPLWGYIGDITRKYRGCLWVCHFLTFSVLFLYSVSKRFPWLLMCAVLLEIVRAGAAPLMDHITIHFLQESHQDFGPIRSLGSTGYIFGTFVTTFLIERTQDYQFVITIYIISEVLILLLVALFIPAQKESPRQMRRAENGSNSKLTVDGIRQLLHNKNFLFLLVLSCITCSMMSSATTMIGTHLIRTLGCSENWVSIYTVVSSVPEILMLRYANVIVQKIGHRKYYLMMIVSLIVRCLGYAVFPNPVAFLAFSALQCFTSGVHSVENLQLIDRAADEHSKATAITFYYTAYACSRAVFGYIWGVVYQLRGTFAIFGLEAVIATFALALAYFTPYLRNIENINKEHT